MTSRRKFIAGLGALATGSAAAMGTGAVSTFSAERTSNVAEVSTDSNGILSFSTGMGEDDAVDLSGDTLSIDISGTGGQGVNIDSVTTIGEDLQGVNVSNLENHQYAFAVQNNDDVEHNLSISYTLDDDGWVEYDGPLWDYDDRYEGTEMTIQLFAQDNLSSVNTNSLNVPFDIEGDGHVENPAYFGPGDTVAFQIIVDTTGEDASVDDDLGGTLEISATTPDQS